MVKLLSELNVQGRYKIAKSLTSADFEHVSPKVAYSFDYVS